MSLTLTSFFPPLQIFPASLHGPHLRNRRLRCRLANGARPPFRESPSCHTSLLVRHLPLVLLLPLNAGDSRSLPVSTADDGYLLANLLSSSTAVVNAASPGVSEVATASNMAQPASSSSFQLEKPSANGYQIRNLQIKMPANKSSSPSTPLSRGGSAHAHMYCSPPMAARPPPTIPAASTTGSSASDDIIKLMCQTAMQPLSLSDSVPRWTGVWMVLEAGEGSTTSPFFGKTIDCSNSERTTSEKADFCNNWWAFRSSNRLSRPHPNKASNDQSGDDGVGEISADCHVGAAGGAVVHAMNCQGTDSGSRSDGDSPSSDEASYSPNVFHSRAVVKQVVEHGMVSRTLLDVDLKTVLFIGVIERVNEVTSTDLSSLFSRAARILRQRCAKKDRFSWSLVCLLELLSNNWSSSGFKSRVNGAHFLPLNSPSGKGHTVDQKRFAWCLAAPLSECFSRIFAETLAAARKSGAARRARLKDPFVNAKQIGAKRGKLSRLSSLTPTKTRQTRTFPAPVPSKSAVISAVTSLNQRHVEQQKVLADTFERAAAAMDGIKVVATSTTEAKGAPILAPPASPPDMDNVEMTRPIPQVADEPLWVLQRASESIRMHQMWRRRVSPLLPESALLSVTSLSGQQLSSAALDSTKLRAVLPRTLLKNSIALMSEAKKVAQGMQQHLEDKPELVVQITVGNFDNVYAFESALNLMASVLSFNEAMASSTLFVSWVRLLEATDIKIPAILTFFVDQPTKTRAIADAVCAEMSLCLTGDCVWALPVEDASKEARVGAFGGYAANVSDVCEAGQRAT